MVLHVAQRNYLYLAAGQTKFLCFGINFLVELKEEEGRKGETGPKEKE